MPLAADFTTAQSTRFSRAMRIAPAACLLVALVACGTGCATVTPRACPDARPGARTATVFFATDRQRNPDGSRLRFGGRRTDPPSLNMGWERVAIGSEHQLGKVDRPVAILAEHADIHPVATERRHALRRTDAEIDAFVRTTLKPAIRSTPVVSAGQPRQVLLYIHGFNTTFDESVRKTAQLAGDLGIVTCAGENRGVLITYSWPAEGALWSYFADEENAEWTQQRLAPFIHAVARACREEGAKLNLIAHSMGARALVRSLADLSNTCGTTSNPEPFANHVVLLAPDIGKSLFDQYVERFLPHVGHLTVYVSARDQALTVSRVIHGGHLRLGLLESSVLAALQLTGIHTGDYRELGYAAGAGVAGRMDMIDVSGLFASQFGHSYAGESFIRDLRELLTHDTPAGDGARSNLHRDELRPGVFTGLAGRRLHYFRLPQ